MTAVAGLAALAGCGGGGGGDSFGSLPPPATTTGLVPAAPTLGAVLVTDAATLRPVANGATWTYAGTQTDCSTCTPVAYSTSTTQTAVSTNGSTTTATESSTNSTNSGPDSYTLKVVRNGAVTQTPTTPLDYTGKGAPGLLPFIELRSPVQVGDQVVVLDQRYTDTTIDADRDGKADTLDVAIYTRIIGQETIAVAGRGTLTAVRLDAWILDRVIYSSNSQPGPTYQTTATAWYVPGLGLVRQTVSGPDSTGTATQTFTEALTSTSGF